MSSQHHYTKFTFTACVASTTIVANKSASAPMILELIAVFAMLIRESRPSSSTGAVKCSEMYLQASLHARRYPAIIEVG